MDILSVDELDAQLKEKEWVAQEAALCRNDLKYLCRDTLSMYDWDECHDRLLEWKYKNRDRRFKMYLMPRGFLKTSVLTIGETIQDILNDFDTRILLTSAVWNNARSFLREIADQNMGYLTQKSNLPNIFGRFVTDTWNAEKIVVAQRQKPNKTPTIDTAGIDKVLTSQHYRIIKADDLVTRETTTTAEQIEKVKNHLKDLLKLLDPDGLMDIVGTRWDDQDAYRWVLEELTREDQLRDEAFAVFDLPPVRDESGKKVYLIGSKYPQGSVPTFPKKFPINILENLKFKLGSYEYSCTPAETPILMSDWKTKPISAIVSGDEVVGFYPSENGKRSGLARSKVLNVRSRLDHVLRYKMESGRTVLCTSDHEWYTKRSGCDGHKTYLPAQVGSKLMFVCPTDSGESSPGWHYLAGIFDGEGCAKTSSLQLTISQCADANPDVYASIERMLKLLGISYGKAAKSATNNTTFWLHDSFNVGLKLIRLTACAKAKQIADLFFKFGKRFVREEDRVVSIEYESYRQVYMLETETGNYIAWGYASRNCNIENNPTSPTNRIFNEPMRYWDSLPEEVAHMILVDPAISSNKGTCDAVVVDTAESKGGQVFVVDYETFQGEKKHPGRIIDKIIEFHLVHGTPVCGIEAVGYQEVLCLLLRDELKKRKLTMEVVAIHQNEDKARRIICLQPYWERNDLLIKRGMAQLEEQLLKFRKPIVAAVDILDAIAMKFQIPDEFKIFKAAKMKSWAHPHHQLNPQQKNPYEGRALPEKEWNKLQARNGFKR